MTRKHRPIADAEVVLKAEHSDFTLTERTSGEGEFHFDSVPIGEYRITVGKNEFGVTGREADGALRDRADSAH